jgi:hypothetical protein
LHRLEHELEVPFELLQLELDPVEALVDCIEALVDCIEASVDRIEASVDCIEAPVDCIEALVDSIEALIVIPKLDLDVIEARVMLLELVLDANEALIVLLQLAREAVGPLTVAGAHSPMLHAPSLIDKRIASENRSLQTCSSRLTSNVRARSRTAIWPQNGSFVPARIAWTSPRPKLLERLLAGVDRERDPLLRPPELDFHDRGARGPVEDL